MTVVDAGSIATSIPLTTISLYLIAGYGISRAMASILREAQSGLFCHVTQHGTKSMAQNLLL